MPYGEGANWDGQDPAAQDAMTFDLTVESTPATGSVRIEFNSTNSRADLAALLAAEWNRRNPIEHVVAVPEDSMTAFFLIGPLGDGNHSITSMAATFNGQPREEMDPKVCSKNNPNLCISKVPLQIGVATSPMTATSSGIARPSSVKRDKKKTTEKARML